MTSNIHEEEEQVLGFRGDVGGKGARTKGRILTMKKRGD